MTDETESVGTYADALAAELVDCGHDGITGTHLLDALASTGLTLTPGEDATRAYYDRATLSGLDGPSS